MKKEKTKFDLKAYMKEHVYVTIDILSKHLIDNNFIKKRKSIPEETEDLKALAEAKVMLWIKSELLSITDSGSLTYNHSNHWAKYIKDTDEVVDRAIGWHFHKDNPYKKIKINVKQYWENEDTILEFLSQFLAGYVWACANDNGFIARHDELSEVRSLLNEIVSYKTYREQNKNVEAFFGTDFASKCLVKLSVILPSMWD